MVCVDFVEPMLEGTAPIASREDSAFDLSTVSSLPKKGVKSPNHLFDFPLGESYVLEEQ